MKQIFILVLILFPALINAKTLNRQRLPSGLSTVANHHTGSVPDKTKKYTTIAGIQNLHSTHGTNFNGLELAELKQISPRFSLGPGTEYSWCSYHFDNGWGLTNLKILAVYLDSKMNLTSDRKLTPFLRLSTGVSFENYKKQKQDPYNLPPYGPITPGSEQGFYLYSGGGLSLRIASHLQAFVDVGFKGYHMSLNDLDINPHGLTTKLGLEF
jgi:hypothetical protein